MGCFDGLFTMKENVNREIMKIVNIKSIAVNICQETNKTVNIMPVH